MPGEPELVAVTPLLIAAVRRQATGATIGQLIATSGVWTQMAALGIKSLGHNVVIYWNDTSSRLDAPGGVAVDIGADVAMPFAPAGELRPVETPAGTAAHVKHVGPYSRLGDAYDLLARWMADRALVARGPSWEVYGHHHDDPRLLETDLYRLVVDEPARPR